MKSSDSYGEFKGSTSAKLDIIFSEMKELRTSVEDLKSFKAWTLGAGAVAGFIAGMFKDLLKIRV